jgi:hypothetical protein
MDKNLRCDMEHNCTAPVTYIDDKGYVYCTGHGAMRRFIRRVRKIGAHEIIRLQLGKTIKF